MEFKSGIIMWGFIVFSPLAHADISYIDKNHILNTLTDNIEQQYVEVKKIDKISDALTVLKTSSKFTSSPGAEHTLITYKPKNTCALNLSFQPAVFNLLR
ncbi:hypothetical protein [Pseudoalteromonas peptidolytica]|uniref:hypothetical protein n=2 Tax=Pseudoalteromonas peptidolytica TaxID=61150 RepID=UPI001454FBEB|nr:hypothetical protein [Pseudoalteromonas peptidolytica]